MEIDRIPTSGGVPPTTELSLLGGFRLVTPFGPAAVGTSGQRLLALLALEARPASRSVIAGRLWPDLPQKRALANLRSVVWRLPRPASGPLLEVAGPAMLTLGSVAVDHRRMVHEIRSILHEASASTQLNMPDLTTELLPGWDYDWVGARTRAPASAAPACPRGAVRAVLPARRLPRRDRGRHARRRHRAAAGERAPHPDCGPPRRGKSVRGGSPVPTLTPPAAVGTRNRAVAGDPATAVARR